MSGCGCEEIAVVAWYWLCWKSEPKRFIYSHLRRIINISSCCVKHTITLEFSNLNIWNRYLIWLNLISILCNSKVDLVVNIPIIISRWLCSKNNSHNATLRSSRPINDMLTFSNSLASWLSCCLCRVNFENDFDEPIKRKSVENRRGDGCWGLNSGTPRGTSLEVSKDPLIFNWQASVAFYCWVLEACESLLGSSKRNAGDIACALYWGEFKDSIVGCRY